MYLFTKKVSLYTFFQKSMMEHIMDLENDTLFVKGIPWYFFSKNYYLPDILWIVWWYTFFEKSMIQPILDRKMEKVTFDLE